MSERQVELTRLLVEEMRSDTGPASYAYYAEAVEDDIFEWHFAIFGPEDSEFDGGLYHGRILLPTEYPFKTPSFMLLTPSGEGRQRNTGRRFGMGWGRVVQKGVYFQSIVCFLFFFFF